VSTKPPMTPMSAASCRKYLGTLLREDGEPMPERTFRYRVRQSGIPHRKIGRELVFFREEIDRWIETSGRGFFA
jgi:hypothetical protein